MTDNGIQWVNFYDTCGILFEKCKTKIFNFLGESTLRVGLLLMNIVYMKFTCAINFRYQSVKQVLDKKFCIMAKIDQI